MTGPVTRFFRLEGEQRRLLLQAFSELRRARKALSQRPFRELIDGLEAHKGEFVDSAGGQDVHERARKVAWAVRVASAYAPWKSNCLVQVLAAQKLMQARGIGGAMYIGAARGEEHDFSAHAWLKHGETFITGESGHDRYKVLTTFTW